MKSKLVVFAAVVLSGFFPASVFAGNVFTQWNEQALDTVRTQRLGAAPASRIYAMINIAMYDAVNGIDRARHRSYRDHALVAPNEAPARANKSAAAAAAAHAVLSALFPDLFAIYDGQLNAQIDALHNRRATRVRRGVEWGQHVGNAIVDLRSADGSSPQEILPGGFGAGQFRADFTSAQYRNMTPFAIAEKTPYVSEGPPALISPEYLAAHHEVRLLGDARYVNSEYDQIFRFWKGGGGSARPPGEWIKIAIVVADQENTTRNISATARLFALLGMALGDSTVATWSSKYNHQFWRPMTAINEASTDGNPETVGDPNWSPRNGSKGGSPEHTSGQSAYAGSGSTILAGFYCDNNIEFAFAGDNAIAGNRTFASFSDAATEAGQARIFAGIHFQFSNQAGQAAGRGIAREILANALKSPGVGSDCPSEYRGHWWYR